jgi:hypothetical protein
MEALENRNGGPAGVDSWQFKEIEAFLILSISIINFILNIKNDSSSFLKYKITN